MAARCTSIAANPDVSGIGIRVNLYATTLLNAFIPNLPGFDPLRAVLRANAGVSGTALLITAIIQTAQQQLSLYHALFILHMLFFLGITITPTGEYRGSITARIIISIILTYAIMLLFIAWALYIWGTANIFNGPQPECNDSVKYIFFFKSIKATEPWLRKLSLAFLGIAAFFYFMILPFSVIAFVCGNRFSSGFSSGGYWERSIVLPLSSIYDVVMLEIYVKRNQSLVSTGEQLWSFGQILAMVTFLSTVNEILHFFIGLCSPEPMERDLHDRCPDPGAHQNHDADSTARSAGSWFGRSFLWPWRRQTQTPPQFLQLRNYNK